MSRSRWKTRTKLMKGSESVEQVSRATRGQLAVCLLTGSRTADRYCSEVEASGSLFGQRTKAASDAVQPLVDFLTLPIGIQGTNIRLEDVAKTFHRRRGHGLPISPSDCDRRLEVRVEAVDEDELAEGVVAREKIAVGLRDW